MCFTATVEVSCQVFTLCKLFKCQVFQLILYGEKKVLQDIHKILFKEENRFNTKEGGVTKTGCFTHEDDERPKRIIDVG